MYPPTCDEDVISIGKSAYNQIWDIFPATQYNHCFVISWVDINHVSLTMLLSLNSFWPGDAVSRHEPWSTLVRETEDGKPSHELILTSLETHIICKIIWALMCSRWILTKYFASVLKNGMEYRYLIFVPNKSVLKEWTYCGLVMPYSDRGQHWLR